MPSPPSPPQSDDRPLRFLFLNYEFPPIGGGSGTGSRYLARELVARGHNVEIVTSWFRGLPRTFQRKGYRIRRLRTLRRRAGQCRIHEMVSYILMASAYLILRRTPKPDVIVSFHSIPSGVPGFFLSVLARIPHIVMLRGGDVPGFLPGDLARLHKLTMIPNRLINYQAGAVIANSRGLQKLAQDAFPKVQVHLIRNGVDAKVFTPPPGRPSDTRQVTLLFAGRMTNQKGLDVLVRAAAQVARERGTEGWRVRLIGVGPVKGKIEKMVSEAGLWSLFEFPGWVERSTMISHYHESDVLVFPSRFEGMPNVVLEAMSCGLPILGTRVSGTEELVRDGVNGFLVEADDEPALAARMRKLIEDPGLRCRMGSESRREVDRRWSWSTRASQLEEIARRIQDT